MAYIKVNHQKMLAAANQVENYIAQLDKNMTTINTEMLSLESKWNGVDYQRVRAEWDEMNSSGSTTDKMKTTLKSYAGSIREASKLYKEAQTRAINRANALCK